jgi:iron complex outermembrane recepter protein
MWKITDNCFLSSQGPQENRMVHHKKLIFAIIVFACFTFLLLSAIRQAWAEDNVDEAIHPPRQVDLGTLTVTAEKRESDAQEIPVGMTVLGETQIQDFDLKTTADLIGLAPNLYVTQSGNPMAASYAALRGITSSMTGTPSLGFYVDGVYYAPGLDIDLFDVERVEVLRGPQGTLYGRNSEAGVVNVVTKRPGDGWEGSVGADVGTFDTYDAKAMLSGPLIRGSLGFRGAVRYNETDGYFENRYDGSDEVGRAENLAGRFSVVSTPTDRWDLHLIYDVQHYDSPAYAHFAPLDSEDLRTDINVNVPGESHKDADGLALRAEGKWSTISLVSITTAHTEDYRSANDIDMTPADLTAMAIDAETDTLSQEVRLLSTDQGPLQWLCGLYFLWEKDDRGYGTWMNFMDMGMGVPGESLRLKNRSETTGFAWFGETSYTFFDRLKFTLGLRYDVERKDFEYSQTPSGPVLVMMGYASENGSREETFDAWLPKASLSYTLSEGAMPYASVSRGFKSGGFNDIDNLGSVYDPEFTWNYELGIKTDWFDNRVRVNAALFHIDWTDMQVEIPTAGGTAVYIDNAGEATSQGAELEVAVRPLHGLEILAGGAYTDARYEDYTSGANVYDDQRIMDSPEYTLHLGLTYRLPISGLIANLLYTHYGAICFDPANTREQADYGILNAKIGYEGRGFDFYLYGRNLLDEEFVTRAFSVNGEWYGRAGEPRVVGVNTRFYF